MEENTTKDQPSDSLLNKAEEKVDELTKETSSGWAKIEDKAGEMWENKDEILADLKAKSKETFERVEDKAQELWQNREEIAEDLTAKAKDVVEDLKEGAKNLWDKVMDKLDPEGAEDIKEEKKEV